MALTPEEIKTCIIPTSRLRIVKFTIGQQEITKLQQLHHNYDDNKAVWRDVRVHCVKTFEEFSQTVMEDFYA